LQAYNANIKNIGMKLVFNGKFMLEFKSWGKKSQKGQNAERVFKNFGVCWKIELLIYCSSNFLLCPFFDHNTKWKPFKVFFLFAYMCTTKFKCVVSMFHNLFFMKGNVEKHFSSSTFPKIIGIDSSIDFHHFESLWKIIWLLATNALI